MTAHRGVAVIGNIRKESGDFQRTIPTLKASEKVALSCFLQPVFIKYISNGHCFSETKQPAGIVKFLEGNVSVPQDHFTLLRFCCGASVRTDFA